MEQKRAEVAAVTFIRIIKNGADGRNRKPKAARRNETFFNSRENVEEVRKRLRALVAG
jgi:hypothetical protein